MISALALHFIGPRFNSTQHNPCVCTVCTLVGACMCDKATLFVIHHLHLITTSCPEPNNMQASLAHSAKFTSASTYCKPPHGEHMRTCSESLFYFHINPLPTLITYNKLPLVVLITSRIYCMRLASRTFYTVLPIFNWLAVRCGIKQQPLRL